MKILNFSPLISICSVICLLGVIGVGHLLHTVLHKSLPLTNQPYYHSSHEMLRDLI